MNLLFVCENVYFEHSMLGCNQRCQIAYKQIILIYLKENLLESQVLA